VSPEAQVDPHALSEHTWVDEHAVPHAPQFAPSEVRSTHWVPQRVSPVWHVHWPPAHCSWVRSHAVVQLPQCAGSLVTSVHKPLHSAAPPEHPQLPALHCCPPPHTVAQVPQLLESV
jgi:hypothetical protein